MFRREAKRCCFYTTLLTFFTLMMAIFFTTIDAKRPNNTLIESNPGLTFQPKPERDSFLIYYNSNDPESYKRWINKIDNFLSMYKKPGLTPGRGQNINYCNYKNPPGKGKVCDVDVKSWAPCVQENNFNYHKQAPCIFLKMNEIYGWIPEYYNDSNSLPAKMPQELKEYIKKEEAYKRNTVWVSCEGENPADIENIGPIKYIPGHGFPGYFYPYENSEGYLSPLIAIYFEKPSTRILINIECKAWAKNIIHDRDERLGSVHFELLID